MFTRSTIVIAILVLIVPVAAAIANPTWASAVGLDVWNVSELRERAEAAAVHNRELEAEDAEVHRRIGVKEELINGLIAGRYSLAETTAQFTALNECHPEYLAVIRDSYTGVTDEEKMARNVIDYTMPRLTREPPWRRLGVLARLNAEFHSLFAESAKSDSH